MLAPLVAVLLAAGAEPESLSLDDAVARALSLRGGTAAALTAGARAEAHVASLLPNPVGSYEHTADVPRQHGRVEQDIAWLLRHGADVGAAKARVLAAVQDSASQTRAIVQEVRETYARAQSAQRALVLAAAQGAIDDTLATIADRRLAAGDISALERDRAVLDAGQSRLDVSSARQTNAEARSALARAIAWPGEPPPLRDPLDRTLLRPLPPVEADVAGVPTVRAAVAESLAAVLTLRAESRGAFPVSAVSAGADWDDPTDPNAGALLVVGVSAPIPLWHRRSGEAGVARARLAAATAAAAEARWEARRLAAATRAALVESRIRAVIARDSLLPLAIDVRRRSVRAWLRGETGIQPALDARRRERDIAARMIEEMAGTEEAWAKWLALTGE